MGDRVYKTKEEILERGREVIGIPLHQIDKTNRLKTGKGAIGSVLEESWFGYKINSESNPDFAEAGVELKVTPYVYKKKEIRAKERLVCNIINYMEEYKHTFFTSSFWKKCNTMLLLSYEHKEGVSKGNFTIDAATLFSFPTEDLLIIEKDWATIVTKIKAGKAHELSEGDTLYLGACTKGASAASVRKQPFSELPAKQRAFSLKQSYMTYILNSYIFGDKIDEHIIKNPEVLKKQSFEEYVIHKIRPYFNKTQSQLLNDFKLKTNAKNVNELLLARMLGVNGHLAATEEFQKANILPKTIRVNFDGSITESMSFPIFHFKKIITEDWEYSEFKTMLEQTKFLFVIFRFNTNKELVFDNLIFWNMPEGDLQEVESVWKRTVAIIKEGVKLKKVGSRTFNNLPKASENRVAHVRPHARDSRDVLELPDGRFMPKQCFWLNNTYIREQLEKKKLS
ncbi:DNA mismatch repair protein MutH [Anaerocolumna cellulosilytica]|uniref:DNA mismatch repair protein MutH n=1 Tax=Anaerocolumna cellulosilytica TaxID=433286 RepID=A0A6S6QPS7_9FIRM|nr:Sau3AI family type II restriction endonuclease [Anaerocolumna cellulosilytica]MBB5196106.1 DNA mismatch repair protein MutH [Anaerocolumna cellulosilytica]BCJ92574.1 DNA mismatch repair protein MutH [Anaerocolumna cellulosilytica]